MTCTSGINAIAHAFEGLYATDATPITDMFAVRGIRSMLTALETLQKTSQDDSEAMLDVRADALEASWLCGTVLGAVHMGLHHKLCHTLGGMLNTPHAETHAILLPFTLLYNYGSLTAAQKAWFGQAFDTQDGLSIAQHLRATLTNQTGVPLSLNDIGITEEDLPKVAAQAASAPYPNPSPRIRFRRGRRQPRPHCQMDTSGQVEGGLWSVPKRLVQCCYGLKLFVVRHVKIQGN